MDSIFFIKIFYFLSVVSFNLVCCNLYSDPLTSDNESCDAKDHACKAGKRLLGTDAESEGPTFIGRDGLTRLDGIKVSFFNLIQFTVLFPQNLQQFFVKGHQFC